MAQIGIVGSGNLGANTAFFVAEKGVAHVCMFDIKDGLSTGKALDMMEAAPVRAYQRKLSGTNRLEEVLDSDIIMIAAGVGRSAGTKREDLFEKNRGIIEEIAERGTDKLQPMRHRRKRRHPFFDRLWRHAEVKSTADGGQQIGRVVPPDERRGKA